MAVANSARHWKIWLAIGLILTLVLSLGLASAWGYRRAKQAKYLLEQAAVAEQAEDWSTAESLLRRYASLRGEQAEICARIGRAIDQGAVGEPDRMRALPFYARALSLDPLNDDVRMKFAELQIEDNPQDAIKHADMVLKRDAEHVAAWRVKAMAMAVLTPKLESQDQRLSETWTALTRALGYQPGHVRLASSVAEFGRRHAQRLAAVLGKSQKEVEQLAAAVLDQLVEKSDKEADARMTRLLYRRKHGLAGPADPAPPQALQRLIRLRPSSTVVRLLAAGSEVRQAFPELSRQSPGKTIDEVPLARAKEHLNAAIAIHAGDPAPYWSLAQLQWWCGQREAAVATLEQGLQVGDPDHPILLLRLAETQLALAQWSATAETLGKLEQAVKAASGTGTDSSPSADPSRGPAAPQLPKPSTTAPNESRGTSGRADDTAARAATAAVAALQPIVDMLWAQWYLGVDNPAADPERALALTNRHADDGQATGLRGLAVYLRGFAEATLGRWEDAANDFLKASQVSEGTSLPRLAYAHALYQTGHYREAAAQYRYALELLQRSQEKLNENQVRIELARCVLAEQSQRPAWKRDWRVWDEVLADVRKRLPKSPIPLFLELEAALLRQTASEDPAGAKRLAAAEGTFADSPEFWEMLARYRLRAGDYPEALAAAQTWERQVGVKACDLRADIALAQGDSSLTDQLLAEAAERAPMYRKRYYLTRRFQNAMQTDNPDLAHELLKTWLTNHADDVAAQFQLAQVAWSRADDQELAKVAATLKQLEGKQGRLGRLCQTQALFLKNAKQSDPDLAKQLLTACDDLVTRFPDDRRVRVLEALIAESQGDTRRAIRALRQAVRVGEQDPNVILRLASLLHQSGQSREALELCLTAAPGNADYRAAMLAARILTTGSVDPTDKRRAEELFRKLLAAEPKPGRELLMLDLAVLREHQAQPDEAIALIREALKTQPDAVELKNNLAWFLAGYRDQPAAALKLIDQAIESAGPLPALLDTKGVVLLASGRAQDAVAVLEKSVQARDATAPRFLHLAEAYQAIGKGAEARQLLGKVEAAGTNTLSPRDRQALLKLKAAVPGREL